METPTNTSAVASQFNFDMTTPTPTQCSRGASVSSPRTPTNSGITISIPNAPRKPVSAVSRRGLSRQVPEGFAYHPILQRRGLPPIRKIVF
jgi:hypothetical protein